MSEALVLNQRSSSGNSANEGNDADGPLIRKPRRRILGRSFVLARAVGFSNVIGTAKVLVAIRARVRIPTALAAVARPVCGAGCALGLVEAMAVAICAGAVGETLSALRDFPVISLLDGIGTEMARSTGLTAP